MAIKVYLNENYLIVENGNVYGEGLAKDVRVNRLYVDIPEDGIQKYSFTNVNNISEQFAFRDAPDGAVLILDENGDPYANEAAFETFYLANTGKSSGGATPTPPADLISEDANNALVLGDDDKLFVPAGGGGGGIQSVVAGTNVTVDATDPLNPIVSAIGGGGALPYKSYVFMLSQSSSGAPTVDFELINELSGTPVFSRDSSGTYTLTLAGAFPENKVWCNQHRNAVYSETFDSTGIVTRASRETDDTFIIKTYNSGLSEADGQLFQTPFEIRVYN